MASDDLRKQYEQIVSKLNNLKDEVIYILKKEIESHNIPIHMIDGRIKEYNSLIAKAKRQDIQNPLEDIDDICGIRIICLFLSDLTRIGDIIDKSLEVLRKDDKLTSKSEDQFGYMSIHYVCKVPGSYVGPRYDDIKKFCFEIQIRTIAMHAWDTISHYLDYKSPQTIPSDIRKDFYALSGLFYLADSHFELFFRSSQEFKKQAEERIEKGGDLRQEELNLDTLKAFLKKKYPDRENVPSRNVSILVEELVANGYNTLEQLNSDLEKAAKAFEYYEKHFPPFIRGGKKGKFADVGVVRYSLSLVNDAYLDYRTKKMKMPQSILKEVQKTKLEML
jgi:putative GTP pyrophosphokinase